MQSPEHDLNQEVRIQQRPHLLQVVSQGCGNRVTEAKNEPEEVL